jgi:hypothetical protein
VLNVGEMEAKVREATNEDPWCVLVHTWYELLSINLFASQGCKFYVDAGDCAGVIFCFCVKLTTHLSMFVVPTQHV